MTLDAKALEAVGTYPMPEGGWVCFHCGERFTKPGTARDHFGETPSKGAHAQCLDAADLVERRKYDDMVRALMHDNDKARREAEERIPRHVYDEVHDLNEKLAKQLAALREALGWLLDEVEGYLETRPDDPIDHQTKLARAVLTDTGRGATQWVRVPEGHVVVPVEPTPEMSDAGMNTVGYQGVPISRGAAIHCYDKMLSAAPQAGEPETTS